MSNDEQPAPYGRPEHDAVPPTPKKIRTHHLRRYKDDEQKFAMLTAYDAMMANVLDEAGIEVLLVGDSAANVMQGSPSTLSITVDELLVYAKSVVNGVVRSLVVADLPFGSYQVSPEQAVQTAVRFMKEAGVHAVKMEAHAGTAPFIKAVVDAGIPVMAHIGFTPQAEHQLGGFRVQGRGDQAQKVIDDALALESAGAFCVLVEMVPADLAAELDAALSIPTIGIGAGRSTTGQVLVWQDMLGLNAGRLPRFVKQYADLRGTITEAAQSFRREVREGTFPASEHSF